MIDIGHDRNIRSRLSGNRISLNGFLNTLLNCTLMRFIRQTPAVTPLQAVQPFAGKVGFDTCQERRIRLVNRGVRAHKKVPANQKGLNSIAESGRILHYLIHSGQGHTKRDEADIFALAIIHCLDHEDCRLI